MAIRRCNEQSVAEACGLPDRRQIARKQAGLNSATGIALTFDDEATHPLDQMPREIDTGAALSARIIGVKTSERRLGRHGERNFKMGQQDISDSRHGDDENKYRTSSQSAACGRMRRPG